METTNAESAPAKQMVLGNSTPNNMSLPNVPSGELCGWEPQCPICAQSALNPKMEDSDWEEEDWNWDRQKGKEGEKQKKEDQLKGKLAAEQHTNNYHPPSPKYRPSYNIQDRLSHHYKTEEERRERLEL